MEIVEKQIITLVCDILHVSSLCDGNDTQISQLPFDSLLYLTMIVKLEERFDIEFDEDKLLMNSFKTIKDLTEYIYNKM